ncbi:MAG: outer membrane protein OmpA-like peptidoglycan-associated protein [Ulvibacter sp.]|jgi:outer membrane protein OmpA-like peptidoglycan-associated protein
MKYIIKIFLVLVFLFTHTLAGQEENVEKGNNKYNRYSYVDARQAYLHVVENGFSSVDILQKLGDSYYFTADYDNAAKWYEVLYTDYSDGLDPNYLYRYAQSLKSIEKYETSNQIIDEFYRVNGSDNRAQFFAKERDYLNDIKYRERFEIDHGKFNTSKSDFAPTFYLDDLVFASNGQSKNERSRTHDWNNEPFLDLYIINVKEKKESRSIKSLSERINTKYHESTAVFSKDGKTVYFTRNNYTKGSYKKDSLGANRLKIYQGVKKDNGKWEVEEVSFNNNEYSVAHPALSVDEKTLYFASDMPGGKGFSDLYKVEILENGFTEPVSLGDGINTKERETFPFVGSDNRFYFASDGHVGLGGLDIFVTEIEESNIFGAVYNVGKPINSPQDDFTFIINAETEFGYFASNRPGGDGDDDIYRFKRIERLEIPCDQILEGYVLDAATKDPIPEASVILLDENNEILSEVKSKADGAYSFSLECSRAFATRSIKEGYSTQEKSFISAKEKDKKIEQVLLLERGKDLSVDSIELGSDLAKTLNLNPIRFASNSFNIRPDAAIELQKLVALLNEYPNVKIDVRAHTDSKGRDSYNKSLSDRRAKSTMEYIVEVGGINKLRISGSGYGESMLINNCSNGVKCEDNIHQQNRRSEFIVVAK